VLVSAARRQLGVSMIEVLVTLVIAAFGVLGLAGLQAWSVSMQVDSETRRTAASLLSQLRERVTANQQGYGQALGTQFTRTLNPADAVAIPACADANACDAVTEVPAVQVALWMTELRRQLPEAAVRMEPTLAGSAAALTVTVGWIEPNARAVAPDAACDPIASVRADPRYRCMTATFFPG
jgi:type IV pilus assembly protein PilV